MTRTGTSWGGGGSSGCEEQASRRAATRLWNEDRLHDGRFQSAIVQVRRCNSYYTLAPQRRFVEFAKCFPPPNSADLDRRRRAIIEAARSLFVEQGYERTTLSEIVDRAGGSLATVYKLFGNKDGLLEAAVFERTFSGDEIVRQAMSEGGSARNNPSPHLDFIRHAFPRRGNRRLGKDCYCAQHE